MSDENKTAGALAGASGGNIDSTLVSFDDHDRAVKREPRLPTTDAEIDALARGLNEALSAALILSKTTAPPDELEAVFDAAQVKIEQAFRRSLAETGADPATVDRVVRIIYRQADILRTTELILRQAPPAGSA